MSDRPVVAMMSTWDTQCGIATYTENLVRALQMAGGPFDYCVLAEDVDGKTRTETGTASDLKDTVPSPRCWSRKMESIVELTKELVDRAPALLHIQHENGLFLNRSQWESFMVKTKFFGLRVALTVHCVLPPQNLFLGQPDAVVVHGTSGLDALPPAVRSISHVIPHGTTPPAEREDRAAARKKLGIEDDEFVFATVGHLSESKGYLTVAQAVKSLLEKYPKLRYYVVGHARTTPFTDPNYFPRVIGKLGLTDVVRPVTGYLSWDGLRTVFSAVDALIILHGPTYPSASGSVRLGATYGLPTIVSTSAIFHDVPSEAALRVPYQSVPNIAEAIEKLMTDEKARAELSTGIRQWAVDTSWDRTAARHLALYQQLLKQPRRVRVG